jgi:Tol biopolymer transport system component
LNTRIFIYDFASHTATDISVDKREGTIDIDPRFSPSEAKIIFVNTSNDGISQKSIYTQNVNKVNTSENIGYDRQELIPDSIMPDWE